LDEIDAGNRRKSISAHNAPKGANEAESPMDIVNIEQLKKWVDDHSNQFLSKLNTLRIERDRAFDILQEAKEDMLFEKDAATKYQIRFREKRIQKAQLDKQNHQLDGTIIQLRQEIQSLINRFIIASRQTTPAWSVVY